MYSFKIKTHLQFGKKKKIFKEKYAAKISHINYQTYNKYSLFIPYMNENIKISFVLKLFK